MPIPQSRTSAANVDDSLSFQTPLLVLVRRVRVRRLAILGLVSFAVSLVATAPARLVVPSAGEAAMPAAGTIWQGEAAIGDQTVMSWRVRPLRSLLNLGVAADVAFRGGGTEMTSQAVWRPGRLEMSDVAGVAGPGLVNTLIGGLPIRCDLSFVVDLDRVVLAGRRSSVEGALRSGPGACKTSGGPETGPVAVPAMEGRAVTGAGGTSAWLAPAGRPGEERLFQLTIDRSGLLKATVLPAGARILAAEGGRMSIETRL
jgi:hypothetical protein